MMLRRAARCVGAALGMFMVLAACDRHTVDAAAPPYEIVTQRRPESLDVYLKVYRQAYAVCANVRAAMKLPPPAPLVALPADFVIKRSTFLSSGSSFLMRHEEFNVDINDMKPETGCLTRIGSSLYEVVVRKGQFYSQRREYDGHTEVTEPMPLSRPTSNGSAYTEKKTIGGIAMRCVSAALRNDIMQDMCAAETSAGLLLDGEGNPIVLHAREVIPISKTVALTEPVSVQIGKPVSQESITLSKIK